MDSEEDMLDAHDMESGEDDFYSGGTDDYIDSDDGEPDYGFVEEDADDSAMIASHRSQVGFCFCFGSTFGWLLKLLLFRTCACFMTCLLGNVENLGLSMIKLSVFIWE